MSKTETLPGGGSVSVKVIDRGWNKIVASIAGLRNQYTGVGIYGNDGDPKTNLAARATVHEFGSHARNIPKRPFMRISVEKNEEQINKKLETFYDKVLFGKLSGEKALAQIGEWFTGVIKRTIVEESWIPNSALTILRKGSSNPLIDTGDMRASITHKEFKPK